MRAFGFGTHALARRRSGGPVIPASAPPYLSELSFSTTAYQLGVAASGTITGATTGSAVAASGLPPGLTIDGPNRTWAWSGDGSAATSPVTLTETRAGIPNSPRVSAVDVTVAAAPAGPVILAILAGQSNASGINEASYQRGGQDGDVAHAVQFIGDSLRPDYCSLSSDITPLLSISAAGDYGAIPNNLGPGEYLARRLLGDNPSADIVLVPTARPSTAMATSGDPWYPGATVGAGGYLFENMVTSANLACAAAQSAFPGRPVATRFFFVQGEADAGANVTSAAYYASLRTFIAAARSRVTGGSAAPFVIGSMVPENWLPGDPETKPAYQAINAAHVAASLDIAGVRYAMGPLYTSGERDHIHYQPAQRVRDFGLMLGAALTDTVGPSVITETAQGATAGAALSVSLAGSDAHQTFHITGGANASLFEISDAYLAPTLRWTGNGTGPPAGAYAVQVSARDGAGNYGPPRSLAVTVASPYGVGDQGPVTATHLFAGHLDGDQYYGFTLPNVPLKAGLNLVSLWAGGGTTALTAMRINGIAATRFAGGAQLEVWGAVIASDTIGTVAGTTGNVVSNPRIAVLALTGTKAAPTATDVLTLGYRNSPHNGASLTCPVDGVIVGLGAVPGIGAGQAGTSVLGADTGDAYAAFTARRTATGAISVAGANDYSGIVSLAWEKSV